LRGRDPIGLGQDFPALLAAARVGSEQALSRLYRELHPKVLRYLRAQEPSEAEDLASEVWMDIAAGLGRFRGDDLDFRRWTFTIARRRLVDLRRTKARRPVESRAPQSLPTSEWVGDVEAEAMENLSTQAALSRIATLPPDQAEVVLLRVLAGVSVKDVAAIVGKRPGTVRVLQHRALQRLAATMDRDPVTQ
jgi:RNA polymerase sigma-70 factor, ECF subfamily